ncbi:suppressor of fused domain protein [Nocardia huaxiensis]|uniref:Suppressor of fused domain protein n=1 Tax=Nocardia huaxiensis TaxID=2755382 RepID=A0A7D6VD81_9NOCA|nr:suppressor of fused domain protein [Nocardia huaxiensis]QLY31682.1 suppressor of fused domain protein [Nocardia huaxiensis]UFS95237.1 suppressor of fused domain protein [Nocardia huaxiensis]
MGSNELIEDEAPGWAAIDAALARIYGDAQPFHWGTVIKWMLGGPDPLDGISVYARTEPVPHWHYISYGMSELYDKESDNPDESGWGFEFTFRLARKPEESTPPVWAASLLQNLGRYVFKTGNWFEAGHHMNVNGPIAADREDSAVRAIAFTHDPELGTIGTPHGQVQFLQVVGLTGDEYDAARQWRTELLLEALEQRIPLYVTDIERSSLLQDPELATAVAAGIARDGSSAGSLFVSLVDWELEPDTTVLRLGALQAPAIADVLRGRLPHDRPLLLESQDRLLRFVPGDRFRAELVQDDALEIELPAAALDEFTAALRPEAGRHTFASLPGLELEIWPTHLRDEHGNETGQVVG